MKSMFQMFCTTAVLSLTAGHDVMIVVRFEWSGFCLCKECVVVMFCNVLYGSLHPVSSLPIFFYNWIIDRRHLITLTFYYINLKPPPTAMSIKNKQKTPPSFIFFTFIQIHRSCMAVWRIEDWISTWFHSFAQKMENVHLTTCAQGNHKLFMTSIIKIQYCNSPRFVEKPK